MSKIPIEDALDAAQQISKDLGLTKKASSLFEDLIMTCHPVEENNRLLLDKHLFSIYCENYIKAISSKDITQMTNVRGYKRPPVDIEEFLESNEYMGQKGHVRPVIKYELDRLFSNRDKYIEVVLCLQKDTKIPLLEGKAVTIQELADTKKPNEKFWVLSYKDGKFVPAQARFPHKTGTDSIWRVEFTDGTYVEANSRHQFYKRDGSKIQVDNLKPKDRLISVCNHEVKRVYNTGRVEDVYCMTVEDTGCFFIQTSNTSYLSNCVLSSNSGGVGIGKSFFSEMALAYMVYLNSCLIDMQAEYDLAPGSSIYFILQSVSMTTAKRVLFDQMMARMSQTHYFTKVFPFDKKVRSMLKFPNSLYVTPVSSTEMSAIGLNVFAGCFLEGQRFLAADGLIDNMTVETGASPYAYVRDTIKVGKATKTVMTGFKNLVKLYFDNGESITCSTDQMFEGIDGKKYKAKEGECISFKFASVQNLRGLGYVSDKAPEVRTWYDGEGLPLDVSESQTFSKKDYQSRKNNLLHLRRGARPNNRNASKQTQHKCSGLQKALRRNAPSYFEASPQYMGETKHKALASKRQNQQCIIHRDRAASKEVRCIRVDKLPIVAPVYDLEDVGYSHMFLASTENGFLVAKNCISEANFFQVISDSKLSRSADGTYDQAEQNYSTIMQRMRSRFDRFGKLPGMMILDSSSRYPGDFLDRKMDEAKSDPSIFVMKYAQWEALPADRISTERFLVEIGNHERSSRILPKIEMAVADAEVIEVPMNYFRDFQRDCEAALRDFAGIVIGVEGAFIRNRESVIEAVKAFEAVYDNKQLFSMDDVIIDTELDFNNPDWGLLINQEYMKEPSFDPDAIFVLHADIGIAHDSTGLAVGHIQDYVNLPSTSRYSDKLDTFVELTDLLAPVFCIDGIIRIRPPHGGEVHMDLLRGFIFYICQLLNVKFGTFDRFSSTQFIQGLRRLKVRSGLVSTVTTTTPYNELKAAYTERRILHPNHSVYLEEILGLQFDPKKNRIDHKPGAGKDTADAVASIIHILTNKVAQYNRKREEKTQLRRHHSLGVRKLRFR